MNPMGTMSGTSHQRTLCPGWIGSPQVKQVEVTWGAIVVA
jgi:hypothetical protein